MQTPKSKTGTLEVPKRKSPAASPRAARQLKPGSDDSLSSPNQASLTPKDKSPKVVQRRSPQSPLSEKKRPGRVAELEAQLTRLQEDLNKAKGQLSSSESSKRQAQQEADEARKQVIAMSAKFEESQQQLQELSASDDDRIQELRKLSHERDRAWQSELEALQKQHEFDRSALASTMNEIQKLKAQLVMVSEAETTKGTADAEIEDLRIELAGTQSLVDKLKAELFDRKESEAQAEETIGKTEMQLDIVNTTAESLRSEGMKAKETLNSLSLELEQSKARVQSLEELVSELQADQVNSNGNALAEKGEEETNSLKEELNRTKYEMGQLKSALEAVEMRYQEEHMQSTLQIRNANEQVELTKSEWSQREAHLAGELNIANTKFEDLRAILMEKETKLQILAEENEELRVKIEQNKSSERETELASEPKKLELDLADLEARLIDKETELQGIAEENEMLKIEIKKIETERSEGNNGAIASLEAARAAEQEALVKLTHMSDEAERNSKRAARVAEQLDAAQSANTEMEAEMRRLKVQSDQWRKAAEAAASMLSTGNNGKLVERTGSLDSMAARTGSLDSMAARMGSPYPEYMDDDSPKKKNGNMLKKIGGLWKKGHS